MFTATIFTTFTAVFAHSGTASSTVYLMRHCARATYLPDLYGGQKPEYLANYSDGGDLPDWGVAPTLCTARGRKIVVGEGRSLKSEVLKRIGSRRLKVIYDAASKRDNTTALDFLTGLGLQALERSGEPEIFDPDWAGCPKLSPAEKIAAVQAQLASVKKPARYAERIAALQTLLGKGVAPPMQDIPDVASGGPVGWLGGSFAASSWIEAMFLQLGAGCVETTPPHNTLPSTQHPPLHTTPFPPHNTLPSAQHPPLHTTPFPPHNTLPSAQHPPLGTTPFPPRNISPPCSWPCSYTPP